MGDSTHHLWIHTATESSAATVQTLQDFSSSCYDLLLSKMKLRVRGVNEFDRLTDIIVPGRDLTLLVSIGLSFGIL